MKNDRGFTLVEVLAVVTILLIIITIITPKIFKHLKTAENVTDQEQINTLINTAKLYMNQNSNLLPQENDLYVIQLQELKDSGLIKTNQILNPSTKQELKGCILVKYENNKYKYEYKEDNCGNQITVTFDPQGGTINQTTKTVIYNDTYGSLPTPTREGYKFIGWRGKNLFNFENAELGYIDDADGILKYSQNSRNSSNFIEIKPDIDYTISPIISSGKWGAFYDQNKNFISGFMYMNGVVHSPSNAKYIRFTVNYENSNVNYATTTQLEEGDTATGYEPYQEYTSDTIVTRRENHTLYAIWKPYYTVTFDANGGTLSQNTKQVLYNEPYGELPTPTRDGYTFLGWNGKNLFNKESTPETQNEYIRGDGQTVAYDEYSIYQVNVNPNTTYTITNSGKSTAPGYVIYDSSGTRLDGANYANTATITFTTPATASYIKFSVVTKTTSTRYDKETFQLEPGSTATEYEPYYITPTTQVVQGNDHTLKAIWQPNS